MKSQVRYFAAVFLLLQVIAIWDFAIRLGSGASWSCMDVLAVVAASSVPIVLVASLVFFLGDWAWLLCLPVAVWGVVCTAVETFFQSYFADCGQADGAFAVRFLTLSWEKALVFASESGGLAVWGLSIVAMIVFLIVSVLLLIGLRTRPSTVRTIAIGALIAGGASFQLPKVVLKDHFCSALFDHVFLGEYREMTSYRLAQAGAPLAAGSYRTDETNLLAVLVIGESASSRHWSLYGYTRETTPRIDALRDELVVFADLKAVNGLTRLCYLDLFAWGERGREVALAAAAVSAGYDTAIIGNQYGERREEGADELLFKSFRSRNYLKDTPETVSWDEETVPCVTEWVSGAVTNRLVVVHLAGSHSEWNKHYPAHAVRYAPDFSDATVEGLEPRVRAQVNHYDNTIAYTDGVLADLIETVRATGKKAVLVYVSDHGETPRTYARDDHCADELYSVPFVVWTSPAFNRAEPEKLSRLRQLSKKPLTALDCPAIFRDILGLSR